MRKLGVGSLLAVATMAAGLAAGPAGAAAFKFTPIGTTPGGLDVEARIQFADGAGPVSGTEAGGPFVGILSFLFKVGDFEADLADLAALQSSCASFNPLCGSSLRLTYDLAPTVGSVYYNDTGSDFEFKYDGLTASGFFNSDNPAFSPCDQTGDCTFRGTWTAVGEPASLAALLFALGIGLSRRRR